ncbi:phosphoinositide-dependent kinase-1 [Neoconidiobolus thromboides FSU 785]|nr:phosphoinositide-dependent kinase-1 [Neoconidiobolus thromboides FSU 785]
MNTSAPTKASSQPIKRTVNDFKFGRILGEGSYSTVVEAIEIKKNKSYAAKVISKKFIIKENKVKYISIEKQALSILNKHSPFIVQLHYTFQDPLRLFYILDLVPNGDLLYYLKKKKIFELPIAKFYLAEIVEAIEYMRSKGIAHRDLKPENILLDQNMHIKITDFGSAKICNNPATTTTIVDETKVTKTNSFVGTAHYASPELLEDKDANQSSDLWALGCICYQFLTGITPFNANNDYQIFQKIVALDYKFTDNILPIEKDFIQKLLVKEPESRLGALDFNCLKQHPIFDKIDFKNLHNQLPPPLNIKPPTIDNFNEEEWFHLDENKLPLV